MDANAVGRDFPDHFGNRKLASLPGQSLATAGDTTLVVQEATKYIVRRVTLSNFSGNASAANVGVYTSTARGGDAIVAAAVISTASTATAFVDLTLASAATTSIVTDRSLNFNVASAASVTCDVNLYGDIVSL